MYLGSGDRAQCRIKRNPSSSHATINTLTGGQTVPRNFNLVSSSRNGRKMSVYECPKRSTFQTNETYLGHIGSILSLVIFSSKVRSPEHNRIQVALIFLFSFYVAYCSKIIKPCGGATCGERGYCAGSFLIGDGKTRSNVIVLTWHCFIQDLVFLVQFWIRCKEKPFVYVSLCRFNISSQHASKTTKIHIWYSRYS